MSRNKRQRRTVARPHTLPTVVSEASLRKMVGMPVCAVLKDGSLYIGTLQALDGKEITLRGVHSDRKVSTNADKAKAQISALGGLGSMLGGLGGGGAPSGLGGLGGLFGGGAAGGAGGGAGGFNLGGLGNWFRIGLGVMQFIFPLMKGFGI